MIAYLIKMTLCSGLLLAVYHLLLEKEKMHQFNRFYLLLSIGFCFIVPLISLRLEDDIAKAINTPIMKVMPDNFISASGPTTAPVPDRPSRMDLTPFIILLIYILVTGAFLARLIVTLINYIQLSWNKGIRYANARLILTNDSTATHTFLNTIFVSKTDYNGYAVEQEVLTHELAHVQQKHSLDILFIELARSIAWFNPIFILYKRAIQLNHEFLADDAVINTHRNISSYQHLLLDKISQSSHSYLSSSLNFLIAKKRLAMMTQKKNKKRAAIKTILVVALMTGTFFLFSEKTYSQEKPDSTPKLRLSRSLKDSTPPKVGWIKGPKHGDGVTQEEFDEYEKAVKSAYKPKTAPNGAKYYEIDVTGLDIRHLRSIYENMSPDQQSKATRLLGYIPKLPPPAKRTPTVEQLKQWQDPSYAGVWLDGKRIDNKELAKYKPSDFAYYFVSKLYPNAINYGKHKYQVNLDTPSYFEKAWAEHADE